MKSKSSLQLPTAMRDSSDKSHHNTERNSHILRIGCYQMRLIMKINWPWCLWGRCHPETHWRWSCWITVRCVSVLEGVVESRIPSLTSVVCGQLQGSHLHSEQPQQCRQVPCLKLSDTILHDDPLLLLRHSFGGSRLSSDIQASWRWQLSK